MTSPRPHYAQPGPGPSNYYSPQTPPPTHFNYNPNPNHAGPSNGYAYQYPPTHMYAQPQPQPQPTHSPRMNGRGGYRGGYPQQNYPPHPHQPYIHAPYAQPPKFPNPHAQTFPAPYSYHPGPYSPSPSPLWQPQPHMIHPYENEYQQYHQEQPHQSVPISEPISSSPSIKPKTPVPAEPFAIDEAPPPPPPHIEENIPITNDSEPDSHVLEPEILPPSSPVAPSASISDPSTASTSIVTTFTSQPLAALDNKWVVWSRRPTNPSHAPGLIFSKNSHPPSHVVDDALPDKTPPASPVLETKGLPGEASSKKSKSRAKREREKRTKESSSEDVVIEDITASTSVSQTTSTVPSSSATAATDTPTLPGSPASSNTSISVVAAGKEKEGATSATTVTTTSGTEPTVSAETTSTSTTTATTPAAVPDATSTSTPAPAPATPPVKKSWASLLKSSDSPSTSSSSSSSGPAKNALPTSSVVGFSIPAEQSQLAASPSGAGVGAKGIPGVSSAKSAALLTLLTGQAPAPTSPTSPAKTGFSFAAAAASAPSTSSSSPSGAADPSKIRPRGLINTGNMCFANSVLQVLLYCPPFFRLFFELGKHLPSSGVDEPVVGNNPLKVPLVKATIEFLRDFLPPEKKSKEGKGESGVGSGASPSGSGKGKGKEKEKEEYGEEDEWERESFIPTYVYDAMKEKKRFDGMRGGHQEDAEEFFGFYLETLEEELLAIQNALTPPPPPPPQPSRSKGRASNSASAATATPTPGVEEKEEAEPPEEEGWLEVGKKNRMVVTRTIKTTESPITRIFGGKFRSTLKAGGQKDSATVEDWRSLKLDIQPDTIHTIQDAISYHARPSPIQMTLPASHPTRPNQTIEASQQVLIDSLPPILVIHLKRFCYDVEVGGVVKVGKRVAFGEEIVIGGDVMSHNANTNLGKKAGAGVKYKLFGAIYHHGLSASGGHYTLDVLHPNRFPAASNPASGNAQANAKMREGWIRIDDELVSDVRYEDVFGEGQEKDETRCAYLLFYRRVR
ncbi:hypothetical protein VKT23_011133 [Stygiomarasmius scandens]|uniref:ubiquitinyl hydrolase 1 n=1 Tax=Marasmiellus scandens TaxID=2682957 RepID=A0ABR1J9Y2_9AGAR